jgi:site-specific DNA-methyltransferase (adenine-specific)
MNCDWKTPRWLIDELMAEFGGMYDPCPLNAKFDGLAIEWEDVNFINPPYSRKLKEAFINKSYEESKKGKVCIMLLPVSTSTKIFHDVILPNAEIRFLRGRVKFEGYNDLGEKVQDGTGKFDSMLVIFGSIDALVDKYHRGSYEL